MIVKNLACIKPNTKAGETKPVSTSMLNEYESENGRGGSHFDGERCTLIAM